MKRQRFYVTLAGDDGLPVVPTVVKFAHNSGVRQSESLVRVYARQLGTPFHGEQPIRDSAGYRRTWTNQSGVVVTAMVWSDDDGQGVLR